jgi:hypothetical protein
VVGGPGQQFRQLYPERFAVLQKSFRIFCGVIPEAHPLLMRIVNSPVIYVCDVHDMKDPVIPIAQIPSEKVLKCKGSEVADMRIIVNRRPAGIKSNYTFFQGMEFFVFVTEGIVQFEHNASPE